jgi:hypothetical protein
MNVERPSFPSLLFLSKAAVKQIFKKNKIMNRVSLGFQMPFLIPGSVQDKEKAGHTGSTWLHRRISASEGRQASTDS